jgi:organic radical activating enzyme
MYISEIFGPTIQGEGLKCGTPSIFIRFAKCNMKCIGLETEYKVNGISKLGCDSFHAVDIAFKNEWLKINDEEQIISKVAELKKGLNYKPDIVITGGEPLIYFYL